MAVQYKVTAGHTIPNNLNLAIIHQSYCSLNFHFLRTPCYFQDHYRYYNCHISCDYTDVSCLTVHAFSNQHHQKSSSRIPLLCSTLPSSSPLLLVRPLEQIVFYHSQTFVIISLAFSEHVIFLIGCGPQCLRAAYYCTVLFYIFYHI